MLLFMPVTVCKLGFIYGQLIAIIIKRSNILRDTCIWPPPHKCIAVCTPGSTLKIYLYDCF